MKNTLFTLLLLISFSSFGQDCFFCHGLVTNYYESGEVEYQMTYVDDLAQGEEIGYYENGEIKEIKNYKDGELIEN